MPAGANPVLAGAHQNRLVEPKALDRGAANRRQAKHKAAIFRPGEVIGPALVVGIKEGRALASVGIDAGYVGPLQAVAVPARQTEVVRLVAAAEHLGMM